MAKDDQASGENKVAQNKPKIVVLDWGVWLVLLPLSLGLVLFVVAYIGAVSRPEWALQFFGIQETVAETHPTISSQGHIMLLGERPNVFEKLGPVGDYFGGTINPILTFLSIILLVYSIKIQREEMKAATTQAENSAKAAKQAVLISKINERPFIIFHDDRSNYKVFCYIKPFVIKREVEVSAGDYICKFFINIKNIGKSFAVIKSMEVDFNFKIGDGSFKVGNSFSTPLGVGDVEKFECPLIFTANMHSEFVSNLRVGSRMSFSISYEDSFQISYKSICVAYIKEFTDERIFFEVFYSSFEGGIDLAEKS